MIKKGNDKVNRILYRGTDDVARAELGGDWRIPTRGEWKELIDNTTYEIISESGKALRRFTSLTNGNSIVFPCGGYARVYEIVNAESIGYYLSNSLNPNLESVYLAFMRESNVSITSFSRPYGANVRAVSTTKGVDLGLPSGLKWMDRNIGANSPTEYGDYYAWGELATNTSYSWSTNKFNPSGDGATFTKYNATDGKRTLELDCECEIEKVMQGGDTIFFKPIEHTKDLSSERLSLVSACAVLDALQPVTTAQTITLSAYTSALIMDDDTAMDKVMSAMEIGWNIVLN